MINKSVFMCYNRQCVVKIYSKLFNKKIWLGKGYGRKDNRNN